jgi:hypothetical protein
VTAASERFRPGVTVILTLHTRRVGALLRAGDLDRAALLEAVERRERGDRW